MIILTKNSANARLLPEKGALISELNLQGKKVIETPTSLEGSAFPDGGIPLCFPFAGRVWHQGQVHRYGLAEDEASRFFLMPIHGFAYSLPWEVAQQRDDQVTCSLESNEGTLEIFPFHFTLSATYTLEKENTLSLRLKVQHLGPKEEHYQKMPVALGFHPYFSLPDRESWFLNHTAQHAFVVTPAGAAGKVVDVNEPTLSLSDPRARSFILDAHEKTLLTLASEKSSHKILLSWTPTLQKTVLWQPPRQDLQCVEPWMALPDAVAATSGAQWLNRGESLGCEMTIQVI